MASREMANACTLQPKYKPRLQKLTPVLPPKTQNWECSRLESNDPNKKRFKRMLIYYDTDTQ